MAIIRLSQLNWLTNDILATFLVCLLTGCSDVNDAVNSTGEPPAAVSSALVSPPAQAPVMSTTNRVGHMSVIMLENKGYTQTFGSGGQAPYLASTLTSRGVSLTQHYDTGHSSSDSCLTMISGQTPNIQTQADCQYYTDQLGTMSPDANGQVTGTGCVYSIAVGMVTDQLDAKGLAWHNYMEDVDNDLTRNGRPICSHPALNGKDDTRSIIMTDGYATHHNPLMYSRSVVDNQSYCDNYVARLDSLAASLNGVAITPAFSFTMPNLCNDDHDEPIRMNDKSADRLPVVSQFLQAWVPQIVDSSAFQSNGLLIVTLDEADTSDTSACCGEPIGPNSVTPGLTDPGGGHVGAVVLSLLVGPGTVSDTSYDHYTLLRSIEDVFGLSHLGYADMSGLQGSGSNVYSATR